MRNYSVVIAVTAVCGFLVACGNDGTSKVPPSSPAAPSATAFETYAAQVIQGSTCENTAPVETSNIEFSFAADQDTAAPRDVSAIAPNCV
ncbi:MAG: hypothetical protein M3O26_09705 [Pseudomonadota bacterium]|nr:hypothetical protein [Pseudomonadota bacterium]